MKSNKVVLLLLLTVFFAFNVFTTAFAGTGDIIIYEKITEDIITKGVTRKNIVRFTNNGWLNIDVITADLNEKYLNVDLLTDQRGINYLDNVLNMAEQNNAVAAINADFFQKLRGTSNRGNPIGPIVKNGQLLSSPAQEEKMAVISVDSFQNILLNYWESQITITAPNGKTAKVKHINKYDPLDSIVIYDRNWGPQSLGSYNNIVEVVVENNIVKEIRREKPPVDIPQNGYIITNLPEYDPFLVENLKVGDTVKLDISINPDVKNLAMAAGGGTILVKDGKVVPFTHDIKGLHPRSALGTDATGKILYMVTVDGRQIKSKGMTLEELAQLLINLGIKNAINLDGGGSTTLVAKSLGDNKLKVINNVSDGSLRNVINAIGIKSSAPKTSIGGLIIETADKNVFVNTSRAFTVKAYDQNYNPVSIDINKVKWSASGLQGKFVGNVFYPTSVGSGIIKATYENVDATHELNVLSSPVSITLNTKYLNMSAGDAVKLSITGKNRFGYAASISLSDVKWDIPGQIAAISNDTIKALKEGSGILTATLGEVNTHASIAVDSGGVVDGFEKNNGSFLAYPAYVEGNYGLSSEQKRSGNYSGKLTFDFTSDQTESKAVYFKLNNDGLTINPGVSKIGLWVYGSSYMNHWLRGEIRDSANKPYRINFTSKIDWDGWKYVEAQIPADISHPIKLTRLYVVQVDPEVKNKGSVYFDDLTFVYGGDKAVAVLPEDKKIPDELNKPSTLLKGDKNFRFSVFGNTIGRKTLLENIIMSKVVTTFNKNTSLSAFVGNIDTKTVAGLNTPTLFTNGYYMFDFKGSTFLHLDNSNDGFRKTDSNQWIWFKNSIENIKNKNVFIFLPKPLTGKNGFTDVYEAQLFKDMLTEQLAKKGKSVFVFYNDENTASDMDRGVRYISTPGIKEVDTNNIINLVKDYKYILVTVNGDEVSYEIKSLFE